jgi:plasmid stabilization system protein ParE
MGYEIIWTKKALSTFEKQIKYLDENWSETEIKNYVGIVSSFLKTLSQEPLAFRKSIKLPNIHIAVVIKQVSIVYRVKPRKKVIELITFLDNRQNPRKTRW